jgi:autotransporter-associated beta strand protein
MASATGMASTAASADQIAATDRAMGIRQTGAFGDPGAAFEFTLANTVGFKDFSMGIDLEMLSVQTRATTWTIDYRVGTIGSFTSLGTYSDPGAFGTTPRSFDLTGITALNNQGDTVTFRVAALSASVGGGSRDSFGIDNFSLNYAVAPITSVSKTWDGDGAAGDNPSNASGTWDDATANWFSSGAHSTWDDAGPDSAVFGTGSGAGNTTVTVSGTRTTGSITFAAGSPNYTITGGSLDVQGSAGIGISAQNNATIDSNVAIGGAIQMVTVGAGNTLTINGQVSGSTLNKTQAGTLRLTNNANSHAFTRISAGVLEVSNDGQLGAAGNAVVLTGGTLRTTAAITPSRGLDVQSESTFDTGGNNTTFNNAFTGGGRLNYVGGGTMLLTAPAPSFGGGIDIEAGTVRVNTVDGGGVGGAGTGIVTALSGATYHIDNVKLGFQGDGTTPGTASVSQVNDGGTLMATGTAGISGSNMWANSGTLNLNVPGAADYFVTGNSVRNVTAGSSTATINVTGGGRVHLASGGVSTQASGTQFSGTWELNMNNDTGVLQVGPILSGGFGEVLNALGYQPPTGATGPYTGETRPVIVNSGTLAIGTDERNATTSGGFAANTVDSIRSPITLAGGKLASTAQRVVATVPNGAPVVAQVHGSITLAANSSVLLYDPVAGQAAGPRSLDFMTDAEAVTPGSTPVPVPNNFSWGANQLSVVGHSGAGSDSGRLRFMRNGGTVSVEPGASLNIGAKSIVELAGTADALSDGSDHVNVVNNGALEVSAGAKNVGSVAGSGGVIVTGATTSLKANHVRGSALGVTDATVEIRHSGGVGSGVSNVGSLTLDGAGKLDLKDNKLVTNTPVGTFTGGAYDGVHGLVRRAYNSGAWTGNGLMTSEPNAGPTVGTTTIGVASASQILFIAPTATGTAFGQQVTGSSTLAMYTYAGDLNFDGRVDAQDYGIIDNWVQFPGTSGYANGDINYDGVIDAADYGIIDNTIQLQGAPIPGFNTTPPASEGLAGVSAVPEPSALGAAVLAGAAMFGRRRRRAK